MSRLWGYYERVICSRHFYAAIFAFLMMLFLVRYAVTGYGVGSDGEGYYMYLPSILIDHDLKFENQLYNAPWLDSKNVFIDKNNLHILSENISKEEKVSLAKGGDIHTNYWPIGMAVLVAPFFILSQAIVLVLAALSFNVKTNGYSSINQIITLTGSILLGVVGFYLSEQIAKKFVDKPVLVRSAIILILFGTFILQYISVEPSMSHAVSFFISTLFIWIFLSKIHNKSPLPSAFITWGFAGGLMVAVRQQNILLFTVPFTLLLYKLSSNKFDIGTIKYYALSMLFFIIGAAPLLISSYLMFGNPLYSPHIVQISFSNINIIRELSALFVLNPVLILASFGLLLKPGPAYKKDIMAAFIAALVLTVLFNAMILNSGTTFGPRRYDNLLFLFITGLSMLIAKAAERKLGNAVIIVSILLIAYNLVYFLDFNLGLINRNYNNNPVLIIGNFLVFVRYQLQLIL